MDTPPIPDVAALVELLGGTERAITLLGVSRTLLFLWEQEGVPAKRWQQVTELLRIGGYTDVTIETIAKIKPTRARAQKAKGRPKRKPPSSAPDQGNDPVSAIGEAA
jgi:hypothetical protein